MVTLFEVN